MKVEYQHNKCGFCNIKIGDVFIMTYGKDFDMDNVYMRIEPYTIVHHDDIVEKVNAVNVITGELAYFNDLDVVIHCDDARICIGHTD